jgi:hypothetical protein
MQRLYSNLNTENLTLDDIGKTPPSVYIFAIIISTVFTYGFSYFIPN